MMLNFKTIMVTDGNAAITDEDHNASLSNFYLTFGDIMSTDFAIGCLKRNARRDCRGGMTVPMLERVESKNNWCCRSGLN